MLVGDEDGADAGLAAGEGGDSAAAALAMAALYQVDDEERGVWASPWRFRHQD
jgi:hypothetical protein